MVPLKTALAAAAAAAADGTGTLDVELSALTLTSEPSAASTCRSAASRSSRRSSRSHLPAKRSGKTDATPAAALPAAPLLQPEPFMSMHRVNGFTGGVPRLLHCHSQETSRKSVTPKHR